MLLMAIHAVDFVPANAHELRESTGIRCGQRRVAIIYFCSCEDTTNIALLQSTDRVCAYQMCMSARGRMSTLLSLMRCVIKKIFIFAALWFCFAWLLLLLLGVSRRRLYGQRIFCLLSVGRSFSFIFFFCCLLQQKLTTPQPHREVGICS